MSIMDILNEEDQRSGGGGGKRTNFFSPGKASPHKAAVFKLRLYRFTEVVEGEARECLYRIRRTIFRPGEGYISQDTKPERWAQLQEEKNRLFSANDPESRKKAKELIPKSRFGFVVAESDEPSGLRIWETSETNAKDCFLAIASAADEDLVMVPQKPWKSNFTDESGTVDEEAYEEALAEFKSQAEHFAAMYEQGLDIVCGNGGMDIMVHWNPHATSPQDYYTIRLRRKDNATLQIEEETPDPQEVWEGIAEAMRKKV